LEEILHTNLATRPQEPERHITLGPNVNERCRYHRCKGHDTERCYKLRDLIEELIRNGHLRKFIEKAAQRNEERSNTTKTPRSPDAEENKGNDAVQIAVNTIAGGFAGGGESSSARK
jgi:predicted RNA-binding protein